MISITVLIMVTIMTMKVAFADWINDMFSKDAVIWPSHDCDDDVDGGDVGGDDDGEDDCVNALWEHFRVWESLE